MRSVPAILADIAAFSPQDGDWRPLDRLLDELWTLGVSQAHLRTLFEVFERFPNEDGAGVLWSVVHGIEQMPIDYENELNSSMSRCPSMMGGIMKRRLVNSYKK
jgi:hypothetical protein